MKKIRLTQGKCALVDDNDYFKLTEHKWYASKGGKTFYAKRYIRVDKKGMAISMANQILGKKPTNKKEVDHIDGNGLNNQRKNLRWATRSENIRNVGIKVNNSSGHKCVYTVTNSKTWQVYVTYCRKKIYLGTFQNKELAARAYNTFAKKHYKKFAKLNLI